MGGSSSSQKASVVSRQTEDAVAKRCLDELVAAIDMEPTQIVVFSSNNSLLRAARERTCRTVAFNPPNERRVDASTDEAINSIADLRGCIESINGISYRG